MDRKEILFEGNDKLIYREGDLRYKMFGDSFPESDILNEALNQTRVEESGLRIPKVVEVAIIDGKWTIVSSFIEGCTLAERMKAHPEKEEEYLHRFVDIQLEMHKTEVPLLQNLVAKMKRKIEQTDLSEAIKFDYFARLDQMPKNNRLCHGDYRLANIIITDNDEAYIIDWSHAARGNASTDAARTYQLFLLEGRVDMANRYLDIFCEKSGDPKNYVEAWLPLVSSAHLSKADELEKDFLLGFIE